MATSVKYLKYMGLGIVDGSLRWCEVNCRSAPQNRISHRIICFKSVPDLKEILGEVLFGDWSAVNAYAFSNGDEMW